MDKLAQGYDLHLITNRSITHTKSRTIPAYWLHPLMQENSIVISSQDAKRLGLKTGDLVKVVSATNPEGIWDLKNGKKKPMTGKVLVTEGTRPGVISFALGFGHWATGAADFQIDGKKIKGDASRAKGIHANAAMWTDPSLRNNTCLIDPIAWSASNPTRPSNVEFSVLNIECPKWFILNSGSCPPAFNMALDEALLEAMPRLGQPVLRLSGWTEPAASFGYFQRIADVERATLLRPLVRRPTGGGIVPHDADWTYSLTFPTDHEWYSLSAIESYRRVHE